MFKRACLLLAAIGLAGSGLALGQENSDAEARRKKDDGKIEVGDFAPDFEAKEWVNLVEGEEPPSLAELRGLVVVVFFFAGWHEGGESMLTFVNQYENDPSIGKAGGVYTIGLSSGSRAQAEKLSRDAKAFFPIGVNSKSAAEYQVEADFGFVVIDATGKIVFKGQGGDQNGALNAVVKALEDTPPYRAHPREAVKIRQMLSEIRNHITKGEYKRAHRLTFDAIQRCVTGDRLSQEVYDVFDLLDAIGYTRLEAVQPTLEKKDYTAAARIVRGVRRDLTVTAAGKDAKRLYDDLQARYDGFRDAANQHQSADEAAKLFKQSREALKSHRYGESYDLLDRILTDHPDSDAAPHAKDMLERMKAMPALWAHVLDHRAKGDCENWISQARLNIRNGQKAAAEDLLLRIVKEYPGTIYEAEARKLLVGL